MSFITRRLRNSFGPGVPAPSKGLAAEWVRFWTELGRDLVRRPCDEATDLFLQAVAGVLSLDPLAPHLTAKTDLVVQVDDVLHAVPLAYLPLKGRRLLERVASVRSVLSPLVSALQRREQQEAGQTLDGLDRRLMVISSFAEDDGAASGAVFLHRQMEELGRRVGYECLQAFDDPPGTLRGLAAGLRDGGQPRRVAALVTCGHGDASRAGVRLADVL